MTLATLKKVLFGAAAAAIGFALAQQDILLPDQVKAALVAVLGWLAANGEK